MLPSRHFRFSELKAYSSGFESALDMVPTGIALLSRDGQIIFMNRSAAALVAERDGLLSTSTGFRAEQQTESELLTKAIRQATSTSKGRITPVRGALFISRRTRPPLQVLIGPIRPSMVQLSQRIGVVVFINDPCRTQRPTDSLLRTLYELTRAECRVALLLSDGRAPREIADTLGVTENTVRSQIKSIYNKTGVKRQSELIRLLLGQSWPSGQGGAMP